MDGIKLNFKELIPLVVNTILAGRVPAIWGPPGIGKSALGRKVREEIEKEIGQPVGFYLLDAPLLQPFDYTIAVPDHQTKTVQLYKTGYLPEKGPAVVLVEDLPHAKQFQVIPLMQIVLDRRIGPLYFSNDVWFIITGNREEDLANVNPLPSPLYNRLIHFEMEADLDVWREWAKANELDPRVVGFVYAFPQYFCQLPQEGVKAWPTPRSWHMLSDVIKGKEDERIIRALASATVGSSVTSVFISWVKYLQELDPREIIAKGELPHYKDRQHLFAIVCSITSLITKMKKEEIKKNIENIVKIWNALDGDYKITFLKELIIYEKDKMNTSVLSYIMSLPQAEKMRKYILDIIS